VNFVNSKIAKPFISFWLPLLFMGMAKAWDVDMSRRKLDFDRVSDQNRLPASETTVSSPFQVEEMLAPMQPQQDIVILNTEKGFIPDRVVVRKGESYRIHLVNVHPEKRNVSFILDDFAENHSTPFAKEKLFELRPKRPGEYAFHCPETSFRGRVIVIDQERKPASK
jgi:hypothetical protein